MSGHIANNRCGAGWVVLPEREYFTPCCRHHDSDYLAGGDGKDRLMADLRFLHCMTYMITRREGGTLSNIAFLVYRAFIFYLAVRIFGWMFFCFRKEGYNGTSREVSEEKKEKDQEHTT